MSVADVERWAGRPLPEAYRSLLPTFRDAIVGEQVLLYPLEYVIERNETLETKEYCPGFIAIGDDSGSRAVLISLDDPECSLFTVGMGWMDPDGFEAMGTTLNRWLEAQCPVP